MDPLVILLIIVTSILTILLVIVGVQVVLILREMKQTLVHVNRTLEATDNIVAALAKPVNGMGDLVSGVRTGLKITESFVGWLHKNGDVKDEQ